MAFVTNLPSHYRLPLFRRLGDRYDAEFFFTGAGAGRYWSKDHILSTEGLRATRETRPFHLFRQLVVGRYECLVISLAGRLSLVAAIVAAKVGRRPYVLWVGIWARPNTAFHRLVWPLVRYLLRDADALLVYGSHVARFVEDEIGRRPAVFEAYQAVDNDRFARPAEPTPARDGEPLRTLFIGRLEPEKGIEVLIDSLALGPSRATLEIAGSGSLEIALRERTRKSGLADRVVFLGYRPQASLLALFTRVDVLVLPSVTTRRFRETWGLVVNEAMCAGLPVIATTAVGAVAGGLVVDGETGLVVPEGDERALAAAIDRIDVDRTLLARLGKRARVHVRRWSHAAAEAEFSAAIDAAIAGRRAA